MSVSSISFAIFPAASTNPPGVLISRIIASAPASSASENDRCKKAYNPFSTTSSTGTLYTFVVAASSF